MSAIRAAATVTVAALAAFLLAACSPAGGVEGGPGTSEAPASSQAPVAMEIPPVSAGRPAPVSPLLGAVPIRKADADSIEVAPRPDGIAVPRLDIDMPVEGVGLDASGGMEIPRSAEVAGWFRAGGNPGGGLRADENAVMAAHVDDAVIGLGPFSRLRDAKPGDEVLVGLEDGSTVRYVVDRVEQTSKRVVDFTQVFASDDGALVLVTCGGRWDADVQHYEDNVLVWAYPEGGA